ncbi:hypothetical protein [Halomontanus rarus]|uniref:hypothetical protein n=1 Tax=Halomontanus rarus TaxID=3034020 RepID=UPI0023E84D70|nr:hypothetical protein [Halovivax sp. TS33]
MSYTAVYGPLRPLDDPDGRKGVRITDHDALNHWASFFDAENILRDAEIKERTDHSAYPRQTWDNLLGFRTWKPDEPMDEHDKSTLGAYHNIERLGFWYGGQFTSFWAGLSLATEPFEVFHPEPEHGLDEAGEGIVQRTTDRDDDGRRSPAENSDGIQVAHVRSRDGKASVDVLTLSVTDVEHGVDSSSSEGLLEWIEEQESEDDDE